MIRIKYISLIILGLDFCQSTIVFFLRVIIITVLLAFTFKLYILLYFNKGNVFVQFVFVELLKYY